ncbi:DegV family EDD domain-containing protein [Corynebacterium sp. 320]|uniref:DegV family protein n=1 Tax=Corynebacterium TaxID=1716 RepID=UPI00125CB4F1|nr:MULTISPECIES: DegV family protein [Corynebacterium]KAB1502387.1 DegV family EDD domain-containing protein [Corynebacterium sp. 320]KAB1551391.1 DegV family EDD domain-containing protein [Corynebacterium sp. 321]KAB1551780.1 DegV family EDD domain-containing protein [Corynebacterium sp. 319]KAB3525994.1 DegV family EDD domain-containing protein [Corynebacterium sp. 250]KAB3538775.1 DegV family EDD domain-containing protein [Corynebacterium sp. 366]
MTVYVVTDTSSCLPATMAEDAEITVLPLHLSGEGADATTAGLGQLELTAAYARLLERGGDDGVVALHLSKELSATWSNAETAAAIFEEKVQVIDSQSAGMVLGYAAVAAALKAREGASLEEVAQTARDVIDHASLWLYVPRVEALRKGGRLSTGQSLLTTTLATRPVFQLEEGKLSVASKARTQSKALDRIIDLLQEKILPGALEALRAATAKAKDEHHDEVKARHRTKTKAMLDIVNPKKSDADQENPDTAWNPAEALKERTAAARLEALNLLDAPRSARIAIHTEEATEVAVELKERIDAMVEEMTQANSQLEVVVDVVTIPPVLSTHTGPGAVAIALVLDERTPSVVMQPEAVGEL